MATMTIKGIDDEVAMLLKERAKNEGISINGLILKMIKKKGPYLHNSNNSIFCLSLIFTIEI